MRLIVVGCEYAGKTTLVNNLQTWGKDTNFHFHMDDHFTIPDSRHLNEDEQERMWNLGPVVKERFQRFQIYYHIHILQNYENVLITGCHIEEAVFGPRYYKSRGMLQDYGRKFEADIPKDTTIVHLTARPEVIIERMKAAPRKYQLMQENEIEEVCALFDKEVGRSWLRKNVKIDTSDLNEGEVVDACLKALKPHMTERDLLLMSQIG
ncbi:MAG: AAA family ATPase [Planctomycetota bacterium]|nr:AAA family ATPase [Planctomycetota bacterium]